MGRVGAAVMLVAVLGLGAVGCGGGDGGGSGAKPSATVSKRVVPRDALEAYERATVSGCEGAENCQAFMSRKLAAAERVRAAMKAKDADRYAEPIGFVDEADRQANHYGRGNLAAKGNMLAVSTPLQRMVAWFREHPEG
jgi:hypothetical protein